MRFQKYLKKIIKKSAVFSTSALESEGVLRDGAKETNTFFYILVKSCVFIASKQLNFERTPEWRNLYVRKT